MVHDYAAHAGVDRGIRVTVDDTPGHARLGTS
jgi:hypothetical protein